jgi:hypothetical protein
MCEDGALTWVSATCMSGRVLLHWSDRLLPRIDHLLKVIPTHAMTEEWVVNWKECGRKALWPRPAFCAEFVCRFWVDFGKAWNDRSLGTDCGQGTKGTEQEW